LSYAFTKEIKHIARITISGKYKIVFILPEVCFVITKQHAEVGHKNIISFGYKNHLDRLCITRKQFI
jgi:hypothetical protein